MPKDSPGQIAKLQLNNMGYSGQAKGHAHICQLSSNSADIEVEVHLGILQFIP